MGLPRFGRASPPLVPFNKRSERNERRLSLKERLDVGDSRHGDDGVRVDNFAIMKWRLRNPIADAYRRATRLNRASLSLPELS